jgi:hypothetical protein
MEGSRLWWREKGLDTGKWKGEEGKGRYRGIVDLKRGGLA